MQSLLLPFVLVGVDTDVAALGAVPEKHNAGVVVAVVVQNAVVVVAATVVVGNNVVGLITAMKIAQSVKRKYLYICSCLFTKQEGALKMPLT